MNTESPAVQLIEASAAAAQKEMTLGERIARMLALTAELTEHADYLNMDRVEDLIDLRDMLAEYHNDCADGEQRAVEAKISMEG